MIPQHQLLAIVLDELQELLLVLTGEMILEETLSGTAFVGK